MNSNCSFVYSPQATLWLSSSRSATIGQQLLQIKYSPSPMTRRQKLFYLFSLLTSYFYEKFLVDYRRLLPFQFIYKFLLFLNFLYFLHQGKYINLFERLARLPTVQNHPPSLRILDYSFMKRELIWHTFNETLGTLIPVFHLVESSNHDEKILGWNTDQAINPDEYLFCLWSIDGHATWIRRRMSTLLLLYLCLFFAWTILSDLFQDDSEYSAERVRHRIKHHQSYSLSAENVLGTISSPVKISFFLFAGIDWRVRGRKHWILWWLH